MSFRSALRLGSAFGLAVAALLGPTGSAAQTVASAEASTGSAAAPRAEPIATYPVAARDLARGEVLTSEDIELLAVPEGETAWENAQESLVGWTTRRVIAAGEPLRAPGVSPPDLVKAGEPVHAVYQGRSVVLRVQGTAAGSAAMGERVLVRVNARRRLEGVVIGPALVQIESNESR